MTKPQLQLPPDYYLKHFLDLLAVLQQRYQAVLMPEHQHLIDVFLQLPITAQRLWVRLLNRKGLVFALNDIEYAEIPDQAEAVAFLKQAGLLAAPTTPEDLNDWLERATKPQLWQWLEQSLAEHTTALPPLKKNWTKAEIQSYIKQHQLLTLAHFQKLNSHKEHWVALRAQTELQYCYFLYFGRFETNLSAFTLRDLGIRPRSDFKQDYQARYTDREQALCAFFYARLKPQLQDLQHCWQALEPQLQYQALNDWHTQMQQWPDPLDERTKLHKESVCTMLGRLAEKLMQSAAELEGLTNPTTLTLAIDFYQQSASYPASERLLRLYYAHRTQPDMTSRLESLLQQMLENPSCDDELWFARDFASRKLQRKPTSDLTDFLRSATQIYLDEVYLGQTEQGAIRHFQQQGYQAFHTENEIWLALFGLLFWQGLFETEQSAIFNEFERRPRDLTSGEFYQHQQVFIEQQLALLNDPSKAMQALLQTYTRHFQKANAIFRWHPELTTVLPLLLQASPPGALASVLRAMAQDFRRTSRGFPDLLLAKTNPQGQLDIQWVELKASGDSLRRHQLTRLMNLRALGYQVSLLKVQWWQSPDRTYVVVDVETTGSNPEHDRITEIAVFKVQYGEIIAEFSTLINPQRRIPTFIQQLTGIRPEMVADAPVFAEIAGQLAAMIGDSIFVAHNVNFDYGFVRAELQRCGYSLQLPKFCTVVQMRRAYPGLASYSLGKLAQHFAIPLEQHHRAGADARATVELLHLIQAKMPTNAL